MLFTPYQIKDLTLKNRIVMAPMCMYSVADESGKVQDWHKIHYPARAVGQVGLIIVEATAVTPNGRISLNDLGIWSDEHILGHRQLTDLVHEQNTHIGIQIAHAGRKSEVPGSILAPSAIAFNDKYQLPEEATTEQIQSTIQSFADAARRAKEAGYDVIELHAAHGYLINEFLSPLSNHRTDEYGQNAEGRFRFLKEIVLAVKNVWSGPLFVRVSAHDYHEEGLVPEDFVTISEQLKELGVDLIDVSSGGNFPAAPPKIYPGYQVPFAAQIRKESSIPTGAVGLITEPEQAEEILKNEQADLIFLGRELLRDPYWPRRAAEKLEAKINAPEQYARGW
ncbi:NADPH2 dehydrogenase [Paenibacillus shirakamiensis]|uniref:NADPH2 dehydrogenase n=2 Tax=Paenibacillus shirakamiensis TaxID=1265935 RepID=A0ABS4JBN6_9BACL|nr:NADPH dehydrogenase NamA [Paenibacillus shirakamiensis]MBP1999123.1 NADPH2 dehydrogenase [Paenibacillus shirakamiensis]